MKEQIIAVRLLPGDDLKLKLDSIVKQNNLEAAWIITCVGSLTKYNIRFANQPKGNTNNGFFEIVSLVGTMSKNGNHIHLSISDSIGNTIGGHLLEGNIIYTTAEIIIGYSNSNIFTREKDGTTPWPELKIRTKE